MARHLHLGRHLDAWHLRPGTRASHRGRPGRPVAVSCIPMLAGAVVLVLAHRASVISLILFASCTVLLTLVIIAIGG